MSEQLAISAAISLFLSVAAIVLSPVSASEIGQTAGAPASASAPTLLSAEITAR